MIAKIRGILNEIPDDYHVIVDVNGIYYEILLPAIIMKTVKDRFQIGDEVTFSTIYDIESAGGFGKMTPRLIGFLNDSEKRFFERIIKVKDYGAKRAVKSLVEPLDQIANAIETGDIKFLSSLPEIGNRSAEKMVAELKGKMTGFLPEGSVVDSSMDESQMPDFKRNTVAALIQLGYKRTEAFRMINKALARNPDISLTDELIKEVFRQPA
jgi:Holliday junction DNA helicase RuvA